MNPIAVPGLQLRQLRTFVTIVEAGTLTAAADRLFKTQGAVSHDLKALERVTGVQLIDRDHQRIELTAAGAALLPRAEGLLAHAEAAEAEMREFRLGRRVVLRIGSLPSLARRVGQAVLRFRESDPAVTIRLVTDHTQRLTDLLAAGRLDMVIAETAVRRGVSMTMLGHDRFQVALPAADRAAYEPARAADLLGRDFIGFDRDRETPRMAERFFAIAGAYPEAAVEATDIWQILELVGAGMGYGLLPESVIAESADVVGVDADPPLVREIAILTRHPDPPSGRVQRFRNVVEQTWADRYGSPTGLSEVAL
ncbi:MAG: LysR family transcriptional regulator [Actinobacteria bacterium]|nr:LysR family transcriptional regulator [Actinomycetota bacterium]